MTKKTTKKKAPAKAKKKAKEPAADEVEELRDKWLRAQADVENLRRRAQLDLSEMRLYGSTPLLLSLLGVLDNLQRALVQPPEDADGAFLDGLRLIEQQWITTLESFGVQRIAIQAGDSVDPSRHRVLFEHDTEDVEAGRIAMEIAPGYMLHDRLLREAQVAVAKAKADADV